MSIREVCVASRGSNSQISKHTASMVILAWGSAVESGINVLAENLHGAPYTRSMATK